LGEGRGRRDGEVNEREGGEQKWSFYELIFAAYCRVRYTEVHSTIKHAMTNEQETAMIYQTLRHT